MPAFLLCLSMLLTLSGTALAENVTLGHTRPIAGPASNLPVVAERGLSVKADRIPAAEQLAVPMPEGDTVVARRSGFERRARGFTWQGKLEDADGDIVLTVKDGALAGSISSSRGTYLIRSAANGDLRILKIDESLLPGDRVEVPPAAALDGGGDTPPAPSLESAGPTLDVLIVYTPEARVAAGGRTQIEALIQNAVDWTNVAYENSAMAVRQQLVHSEEIPYLESENCRACFNTGAPCATDGDCPNGRCARDMGCDLTWLRGEAAGSDQDGDGITYMQALRNQHGADLVALIVGDGNYCGIAYVMRDIGASFADWATSVTYWGCLPSTHAHETGHNLGCMHDPENSTYTGAHDYSFGHRYCVNGGFRTVMSYSCSGVSRVAHFSNPDVDYQSALGPLPTGQWAADCTPTCTNGGCQAPCRNCAMSIANAAPTASQWRATADPFCGDGSVNQAIETCDGNDLGGESCESRGHDGGGLSCHADCTFDDAGCTVCGDGVREGSEACDGADLGGATCADADCGGGTPTCGTACSGVDYSACTACPECGDGVVNQAGEVCDGNDLRGASCLDRNCLSGSLLCTATCTLDASSCSVCCGDGACEAGESCNSCAADCVGGSGAACGNGVCEAGDGEDCLACPDDCRGRQSGKPQDRFCCGDGGGEKPLLCGDPTCAGSGWQCTDVPSATYCCGDGICSGSEDGSSCALDCGPPPACGDGNCDGSEDPCLCAPDCGTPPALESSCSGGTDEDCDGSVDCDDADCAGAAACLCRAKGESCSTDAECCSSRCKRGKSGAQTCG